MENCRDPGSRGGGGSLGICGWERWPGPSASLWAFPGPGPLHRPLPGSLRKTISSQDGADCCWCHLEAKLVRCFFRPRLIFLSHRMLPKYYSESISESCDHCKKQKKKACKWGSLFWILTSKLLYFSGPCAWPTPVPPACSRLAGALRSRRLGREAPDLCVWAGSPCHKWGGLGKRL